MELLKLLKIANHLLGTAVVTTSLYSYLLTRNNIPLYIALAIIIVGPVEDLLNSYIHRSPSMAPATKAQYVEIVDNLTSLLFLVLLGLVVEEARM